MVESKLKLNIDKLAMIMDAERIGLPVLDGLKLFLSDHVKVLGLLWTPKWRLWVGGFYSVVPG